MRHIKNYLILLIFIISCSFVKHDNKSNDNLRLYSYENWHCQIEVPKDFMQTDGHDLIRFRDSSNKFTGYFELLSYFFIDDTIKSDSELIVNDVRGKLAGDCDRCTVYGDKITKWDIYKNNKGTEINSILIEQVEKWLKDTTWVETKRTVVGPFYYIQIPRKFQRELLSVAYKFNGDSIIIHGLLNDFKIQ